MLTPIVILRRLNCTRRLAIRRCIIRPPCPPSRGLTRSGIFYPRGEVRYNPPPMQSVSQCTGWTRKEEQVPQCNHCSYVYDCMYTLFGETGGVLLQNAYDEKFTLNPCDRRKFIVGGHMLTMPALGTYIIMVLVSEKRKHSDSLKRKFKSLDYVPDYRHWQWLTEGEPLFKMTKTQAAKAVARRQEDPPWILGGITRTCYLPIPRCMHSPLM